MNLTIKELEDYLLKLYSNRVMDQSLFMKLVEEIGEVAEVLNKKAGRKSSDDEDLQSQLGKELADVKPDISTLFRPRIEIYQRFTNFSESQICDKPTEIHI